MAGDVHVDEVERALAVDLPRGDYETIAGLVIAGAGSLPEPGATSRRRAAADPGDLVAHDRTRAARRSSIEVLDVERHVPLASGAPLVELGPDTTGRTTSGEDRPDERQPVGGRRCATVVDRRR